MELKVLTTAGTESGEVVTLRDDIFGAEVSEHAVYLDVKSILANRRQGTHKSKTRAEVRVEVASHIARKEQATPVRGQPALL